MRRVVAAMTAEGQSILLSDGPSPHVFRLEASPGLELTDLWAAGPLPHLPFAGEDPGVQMPLLPDPGATVFRLVRIEPNRSMEMHATESVDYIAVLSGEVILNVENAPELRMSAGDCVVQLGGRHAWHNRSDNDCVLVAVVVGALAQKDHHAD